MKKLIIDRKKFLNWYIEVDTDFINEIYDSLTEFGEYKLTAQQLLDTAGYIPENVLVEGQDYKLDDNDDVITEGYDLITFDSNWVVCGYCKGEPVPEEDKEDCECPTCNGDGGWLKVETEPVQLSGVSTDDLKKELESRGYFTENLWHVDDVESQLAYYNEEHPGEEKTLDHDQCLTILESAMTNQWLVEQIFELIDNEISE